MHNDVTEPRMAYNFRGILFLPFHDVTFKMVEAYLRAKFKSNIKKVMLQNIATLHE